MYIIDECFPSMIGYRQIDEDHVFTVWSNIEEKSTTTTIIDYKIKIVDRIRCMCMNLYRGNLNEMKILQSI